MIKKLALIALIVLFSTPSISYAVVTCPAGQEPVSQTEDLGCYTVNQTTGADTTARSLTVTPNRYTPLEPIPGITTNNPSIGTLLGGIFNILIRIGALFAVIMFTWGGIIYMISDVVDKKSWARQRMYSAFWGLVLIAAAWLILNTINPKLLEFNLAVETTRVTGSDPSTVTATNYKNCMDNTCMSAEEVAAHDVVTKAKNGETLTTEEEKKLDDAKAKEAETQGKFFTACSDTGGLSINKIGSDGKTLTCNSQQAQGFLSSTVYGYKYCQDIPTGGFCLNNQQGNE